VAADANINLKLILQSQGIEPTKKNMDRLHKSLQKTAGAMGKVGVAANKTKRNLEGAAQRSGSAGKDFARMSQGMGGLVQAYATVAANVFALSSAFLVLRRAADLSSMTKSAEDFSNRFGVSVTRITRQMQVASGGALSFAEALPTINKAISAGIGVEQMEQLTIAATKAAQTFGGSATEALSRFISAAQRGRVEIIQTLGIVIKTEQAYKDYAATVGKTALELTALDRQQAILNATIKESQSIFDQVNIDPNPFQQLLVTLTDLKDTVLTTITDAITPMVNAFNQSKFAAAALIAVMLKLVGGKIFGQVAIGVVAAAKAGRQTTIQARAAERTAVAVAKRRDRRITNSIKAAKKEALAFEEGLKKQEKAHASFTTKILIQEKGLNIGVATERRAALARNIKSLEGGGKAFAGLPGLEASKRQLLVIDRLLLSVAGSAAKANQSIATVGKTLGATTTKGIRNLSIMEAKLASMTARSLAVSSAFKTGFAQGFQIAEGKVVKSVRGMTVAWRIFVRDIGSGAAKAKSNMVNFSRAMGRTIGIISAGLSSLVSIATSVFLIFTIGAAIWEKYGDSMRGITPEMRAIMDASEEFKDALDEVNVRAAEGIVRLGEEFPASLKKLQDALKFTAGTFASINTAIINFQKVIIAQLEGLTITQASKKLEKLKDIAVIMRVELERLQNTTTADLPTGSTIFPTIAKIKEQKKELAEIEDQILVIDSTMKGLAETITTELLHSLELAKNTARGAGFRQFGRLLVDELNKGIADSKIKLTRDERIDLVTSANAQDAEKFKETLDEIKVRLNDDIAFNNFSNNIFGAIQGFLSAGEEATRTIDAALASLADVENRISNFVSGLDKARAATGPNKEVAGFILDINRELKALDLNQKGLTKNTSLSKIFGDPEELALVKQLLGFAAGEEVKIGQALAESEKRQLTIIAATQSRLLSTKKLKIEAIKLATLKQKEAETDSERLLNIDKRLTIEKNIAQERLINAKAILAEQEDLLVSYSKVTTTSAETLAVARSERDVLEEAVAAAEAKRNVLYENLELQREFLKIEKESLTATKGSLAIKLSIDKLDSKLVTNITAYRKENQEIYLTQRLQLRNKTDFLELEIRSLEIANKTFEQKEKERVVLQAKLALIERETALLIRQQESRQALNIEAGGTHIFTEEAISQTALFLRRALEKEIPKLKSAFEILGEGFSKTIIDTFDTVIDNLLEGGKNFGQVVREALKASLRDVIGNALNNDMKKIFIGLKDSLRTLPVEEQEPLTALSGFGKGELGPSSTTTALDEMFAVPPAIEQFQTTMTDNAIKQVEIQTESRGFLETIKDNITTFISKGNEVAAMSEGEVEKALKSGSMNIESVETVNNSPTTDNAILTAATTTAGFIQEGTNATLESGINLISALWSIAAANQASETAETAGGIVSAFTNADGGILSGMGSIKALADGAVINKPSMAVIGEGKNSEAVVPLPNNREIPVDLKGSSGDTVNIEQNFDFSNANTDTISALRTEARAIEERTFNRVFIEVNKGGKYAKIVGRR